MHVNPWPRFTWRNQEQMILNLSSSRPVEVEVEAPVREAEAEAEPGAEPGAGAEVSTGAEN